MARTLLSQRVRLPRFLRGRRAGFRSVGANPFSQRGLFGGPAKKPFTFRPEIKRDYPLNLSISLSGGKETNQDSPSNGE